MLKLSQTQEEVVLCERCISSISEEKEGSFLLGSRVWASIGIPVSNGTAVAHLRFCLCLNLKDQTFFFLVFLIF